MKLFHPVRLQSKVTEESPKHPARGRARCLRGPRTESPRALSTAGETAGGWMALANSCVISLFVCPLITKVSCTKRSWPSSFTIPHSRAVRAPHGAARTWARRSGIEQNRDFFFLFSFFSEQHCEYIQHIGVYRKCKWFCYTKIMAGGSWCKTESKRTALPKGCHVSCTARPEHTGLRHLLWKTLPFAIDSLYTGSRK